MEKTKHDAFVEAIADAGAFDQTDRNAYRDFLSEQGEEGLAALVGGLDGLVASALRRNLTIHLHAETTTPSGRYQPIVTGLIVNVTYAGELIATARMDL